MTLESLFGRATAARLPMLDAEHHSALRLFSGFYEGEPDLVADLYGRTLVLTNFSKNEETGQNLLESAQHFILRQFPWICCVIQKFRFVEDSLQRRGRISFGDSPDIFIVEDGIRYSIDLQMNQDASFYLDTRRLRHWLKINSNGKKVLNAFAYTGSLGIAALAGGAQRVLQTDRNARFLNLARQSAMLNRLDLGRMQLQAQDFFKEVGRLKNTGDLFDIAVLDPPFFSVTEGGTVDMLGESTRLINKIRPLVGDGGRLAVINNSLFLSGKDFMDSLLGLCKDGYLAVEELLPVPEDVTGDKETRMTHEPTDPAPFNHATKIAILSVRRKG